MSGFQDELVPGCYSELLFTAEEIPFLETDGSGFGSSSFSSSSATVDDNTTNAPRMLCFGDYVNTGKPGQGSGPACTGGSGPAGSGSRGKVTAVLPSSSNRKRNGSGCEWSQDPGGNVAGAPAGSRRNGKKSKVDSPSVTSGHAKGAKKEKLGERITALQQLVSPFGKTDTASVLHEAFGYIKFLQDQVQVLCSPYLQCPPSSSKGLHNSVDGENADAETRKNDLRSRGLCLVPVELTLHVAESNGADLWSSAAMLQHGASN